MPVFPFPETGQQITSQYADAMSRVNIYEKTIEIPREINRKKQAALHKTTQRSARKKNLPAKKASF